MYLSRFTVKLFRTPDIVQRAEAIGLGVPQSALRKELLRIELCNANARHRWVKSIGQTTHVVVASVRGKSGPTAEQPVQGPLLFACEGDEEGFCPDDDLGGKADHPGDIDSFLVARRAEGAGFCHGRSNAREQSRGRRRSIQAHSLPQGKVLGRQDAQPLTVFASLVRICPRLAPSQPD